MDLDKYFYSHFTDGLKEVETMGLIQGGKVPIHPGGCWPARSILPENA